MKLIPIKRSFFGKTDSGTVMSSFAIENGGGRWNVSADDEIGVDCRKGVSMFYEAHFTEVDMRPMAMSTSHTDVSSPARLPIKTGFQDCPESRTQITLLINQIKIFL